MTGKYRILNAIDEFRRECFAIRVEAKLKTVCVIGVLTDLLIIRGIPGQIRLDNGPEFIAKALRDWIALVGVKSANIMPGSPRENSYCKNLNFILRDELLSGKFSIRSK